MKHFFLSAALFIISLYSLFSQIPDYKKPEKSVEERAEHLLTLMTIEEKVGQLVCVLGWEMYEKKGDSVTHSKKFEELLSKYHVGMYWAVYRADPWTQKTLETGLSPRQAAEAGNAMQRYAVENTRLGIPIFIAEEAPHGHMAIGATVFPTGIGQASTWNPELLEKMGEVIAREIRLQGGHISYGPVLDLSRDPRWSRVEESYGEDPVLSAKLAAAIVKGTGGGNIVDTQTTIVTLKHLIAYGIPEGGHNGNTAFVGYRELHENFLPPFKAAIDAGALSVMTGYNSIDGIPCTSNGYLLTDVLRNQWGFKGFTISDLNSVAGISNGHFVAENSKEAGKLAIIAGLNVDLGGDSFLQLIEAVKNAEIPESLVDTAVLRILKLKFEMGLFDNPYVDPVNAEQYVRSPEHIAIARDIAKESIILLKNDTILPLQRNVKIALIGPNADNIYNQLGDYTAPQPEENVITVLRGLQAYTSPENVRYVKGCAIRDTLQSDIEAAVEAALQSDVVVAVVGGSSARDFKTSYQETGAAIVDNRYISDMESGEGFDRADLNLPGHQLKLLQALKSTGKPLIVIYIQGRPLNMNWAAEHADALFTAWYPGQEGGYAVADVLYGEYNPAGRLPISVPKSVGQLPVYYNKKNPQGHDYLEMTAKPLYEFGYGLSYTTFQYGNLNFEQKGKHAVEVSFTVKNNGNLDGDEVVQLYLRDHYASVVQPVKQLKHFQRIHLKRGESQTIRFLLTPEDFSIIDKEFRYIVEPGEVSILIGSSSEDIRLESIWKLD
ncbi:MAG: glycoside hydrolase family 3 C-terminal domain-containing protein [Bacteroidales bacterium]|jgi:beta-glucosidase|nr:glycoside hydrolase family 3 C-terminal domain-containing protein [Bacteroidales bacterium]